MGVDLEGGSDAHAGFSSDGVVGWRHPVGVSMGSRPSGAQQVAATTCGH
jgi:hypothetical protein